MRVALLHQPFNDPVPPVRAGSIAIWTDRVASQLAERGDVDVVVYGAGAARGVQASRHGRVELRQVSVRADRRWIGWRRRRSTAPGRLPYFVAPWYFRGYARRVARDAEARGCGVIHVHNAPAMLPTLRRHSRAALVLHMHCAWLAQMPRAAARAYCTHAAAIVGCSRSITSATVDAMPELAPRCHTVDNGVDLDVFRPRDASVLPPQPAHLVYVGRLSPEKGVHVLIEAFAALARRRADVVLTLAGPAAVAAREFIVFEGGDPRLRALYDGPAPPDVARALAALPDAIRARVRCAGALPHDEVGALYRAATIAVVPSVWPEPFGMPAVEAMACGVPVVASRTGGLPETIVDGETGVLVEPGDAGALAAALEELLREPGRAAELGRAARARAARFAWDAVARQVTAVYAAATRGRLP